MDRAEVLRRREELSNKHGAWHDSIPLGHGVYTISDGATRESEQIRVRSILQSAADALAIPLSDARVLDLGSAEGVFAVEFALHGAEVLAIEGRAGNVEKIQLVRNALALERLKVVQQDVRELSREEHGEFDVVLCLGVLYHLESASAVALAHQMAEVCRRAAIVDTHIAFKPKRSTTAGGKTYSGRIVREFDPGSTEQEDRLSRVSIGNPESIWFTRPSLYNLLEDATFTSVLEVHVPRYAKHADRVTLVALKGAVQTLASAATGNELPRLRWPEHQRTSPHPNQTILGEIKRRLAPLTPAPVTRWVVRRQERHQQQHRP